MTNQSNAQAIRNDPPPRVWIGYWLLAVAALHTVYAGFRFGPIFTDIAQRGVINTVGRDPLTGAAVWFALFGAGLALIPIAVSSLERGQHHAALRPLGWGAVTAVWSGHCAHALCRLHVGTVDVFLAIFGHHPLWMKMILIVRDRIASICGLVAPTASEIMNPGIRSSYSLGDSIGVWPIFFLTDAELIAGRNNEHLDFRLSVLRETDRKTESVVVSTVCVVHDVYGKIYLFFIVPFHRWGLRRLMSNAICAGRL